MKCIVCERDFPSRYYLNNGDICIYCTPEHWYTEENVKKGWSDLSIIPDINVWLTKIGNERKTLNNKLIQLVKAIHSPSKHETIARFSIDINSLIINFKDPQKYQYIPGFVLLLIMLLIFLFIDISKAYKIYFVYLFAIAFVIELYRVVRYNLMAKIIIVFDFDDEVSKLVIKDIDKRKSWQKLIVGWNYTRGLSISFSNIRKLMPISRADKFHPNIQAVLKFRFKNENSLKFGEFSNFELAKTLAKEINEILE